MQYYTPTDNYAKELNSMAEEILNRTCWGGLFLITNRANTLNALREALNEIRELINYWYEDREDALVKMRDPGCISRFRVWRILNKHLHSYGDKNFINTIYEQVLGKGKTISYGTWKILQQGYCNNVSTY